MTRSEIFKKAHTMTRELKNKYKDIDYKTQFSICLKFIINDIKKIKESVKSLNYMQIKDMLLSARRNSLKDFDLMEYNALKEKYNDNLCNEYDLYRLAQLESYILPLESVNDVKAYISHAKQVETLKKAYYNALNMNSIQDIKKDNKPIRNAIKEGINKLKSFMLSPKYI